MRATFVLSIVAVLMLSSTSFAQRQRVLCQPGNSQPASVENNPSQPTNAMRGQLCPPDCRGWCEGAPARRYDARGCRCADNCRCADSYRCANDYRCQQVGNRHHGKRGFNRGCRGGYDHGRRAGHGCYDGYAGRGQRVGGKFGPGCFGQVPCTAALSTDPLTLDETTQSALREALLDEYAMGAYYESVIDQFGASRPFGRLRWAQERQARAIQMLFERAELEPPTRSEAEVPNVPATLAEAVQVALDSEKACCARYDNLMASEECPEDVKTVIARLRDASLNRHIPLLQSGTLATR